MENIKSLLMIIASIVGFALLFLIAPLIQGLISILLIIGIPMFILYIIMKSYQNTQSKEKKIKDDNLYFERMGGVGEIVCSDCNYQEKITSSIHGRTANQKAKYDEDGEIYWDIGYAMNGFQCQSCGKFHTLNNCNENKEILCDCKGILSREKPLFCPKCQSKNMKYDLNYMT